MHSLTHGTLVVSDVHKKEREKSKYIFRVSLVQKLTIAVYLDTQQRTPTLYKGHIYSVNRVQYFAQVWAF